MMERREALKLSSLILAYSMSAGATAALLGGCTADTAPDWTPQYLDVEMADLLAAVCERIIPTTDTPGAKTAMVHRYIDTALYNNYQESERATFVKSIEALNELAISTYGKPFLKCKADQMDSVLETFIDLNEKGFRELKSLTVSGYISSEIGAKMLLEHDPIPGAWIGCIDYAEVGKRWS